MLGTWVILYLFLGGCGAGALLTSSLWSLAFYRTCSRTSDQTRSFSALVSKLYAVGFVVLAAAALCLLFDLGYPERFLLLFIRPTASLLSFGSFALLTGLAVAGVLAVARSRDASQVSRGMLRVLEVACAIVSTALMVYTGLYLALVEAVPLWNNAALPVLLALSSMSSGLALVLIAVPFNRDWTLLRGWMRPLHRVHCVVLALELVSFGAFLVLAVLDPFAGPSLAMLLSPDGWGTWIIVGFVLLGVVVPLAIEALTAFARASAPAFAGEALCILGGLILRFCLVLAASHWLG